MEERKDHRPYGNTNYNKQEWDGYNENLRHKEREESKN